MNPLEPATYRELTALLEQLGFRDESVSGSHCAFRHATSETLVLLADLKPDDPVRPEDLVSVRQHLDAKGLMDASAFERRFPQTSTTRTVR